MKQKISNFKMARQTQADTLSLSNVNDYIRCLAPEKIRSSRYNHKYEMFRLSFQNIPTLYIYIYIYLLNVPLFIEKASLGILVWELLLQRISML